MGGQSLAERVPRQRKGAGLARFCVTLRAWRRWRDCGGLLGLITLLIMYMTTMNDSYLIEGSAGALRFNLKQVREEQRLTQIMLVATVGGQRIRVYTKLRVEPRFWDTKAYRCRMPAGCSRRDKLRLAGINERIEELARMVHEEDEKLAERGECLSASAIRQVVTICQAKGPVAVNPLAYLRKLARGYAESINRKGKRGNASTGKTYLTALDRLEEYNRRSRTPVRAFDDFNKFFFADFTNFLCNYQYGKGEGRRHYTQNTIVNTLKVLKNLLHRAYDSELMTNNYFLKVQTTLPSTASEQIYLQEEEIRRLARMETLNEREREVRDMFVISCYTALRISDLQQLNDAVIDGEVIRIFQTKTKEPVLIPILKEIARLVEHYQAMGFPKLGKSRANRIIKELAARCLPDEKVIRREQRGGKTCIRTVRKCDMISFHTARRSCITNLYKRGYPINFIMSLSGHRSVQAFQRYMKASSEELMTDFVRLLRKEKAL